MLKVFLAGEGPTDIGDLATHQHYRHGREGFVQPVVRSLLGREDLSFDGVKLATLAKNPFKEPRDALARQARQACALAAFHESQLLVFIHDLDRAQGTKRSAHEIKKRRDSMVKVIEEGFAAASLPEVVCVPATPCRMIEAWALADPKAVHACGGDADALPAAKGPEEWWGDEQDPNSNHPKAVLRRVFPDRPQDLFESLGGAADPVILDEECPLSFRPFRQRLTQAGVALGEQDTP